MQIVKKENKDINVNLKLIPEVEMDQQNSAISVIDRVSGGCESISITLDKSIFFKEINPELLNVKEELDTIQDDPNTNFDVDKVILETYQFLKKLINIRKLTHNINDIIPDIMALDDGGIGLEWRPKNGIITVSMYGDGNVHLVILADNYQYDISSKFPLSDEVILYNKLTILNHMLNKEKALRNDIYFGKGDSYEVYFSTKSEIFNEKQYGSFQGFYAP